MSKNNTESFASLGQAVIRTEQEAISALYNRIDEKFTKACELIMPCQGRVVVMGMGKSGHIAGKIAATLASTGTPAFFVHPGEASHGDLGMLTRQDVVLALSNSGNTPELVTILPLIKRLNVPFITMTGNNDSELAKAANVNLDVSVDKEACPLGLAPTASTTAALVMGDALAVALLKARGFTEEDFALSHPGGALGKRLLLKIDDVMVTSTALPKVHPEASLKAALVEMTEKKLGFTTIVDKDDKILGIYTDGDLRRTLDKGHDVNINITEVMSKNVKTINAGILAAEALQIMEQHKITSLLVANDAQQLIGAVHLHNLLQAGVS